MARWDPGAEQRLREAALELFREHGYDAVTVTQIAERAGLTRRSFFRYFPDKREVFFAGSDRLPAALAEAVRASGGDVFAAVARVGEQMVELLDRPAERRAIIDGSAELQERERTKMAAVTAAMEEALGGDPVRAHLLAQIGTVTFQNAYGRWLASGGEMSFPEAVRAVTAAIRESVS
ncbi:TetR/AcrR family transcriptional regulator [Actinoplanes bogorensis]|uniref:TetR/AcrR family transcriptional regulator n=1 Tax=Paractinoplanes bogorensis TaxID=1610840 RepID=A0ABS5Z3W0_9ACTN|nr:TetR/AcrR family transcriptional regulator [Actinoplanes bogorensis]MBU2670376.1 TetR/AcrR family transcriptional regulator [Actinoplanes bogorensis]